MCDIKTLHFITPHFRALSWAYSVQNVSENVPFTSHPPLLTEHNFGQHYTSSSRSWSRLTCYLPRNCDSCHSKHSLSANMFQGGQGAKITPCLGVFKEPLGSLSCQVGPSWALSRPQVLVGAWFSASQLTGGMEALFLVIIWEILSVRDSMWQQYMFSGIIV